MSNVIIRPFTPEDRQSVRDICADTADKGEPVENFFPDRESLTDLLCGYYTDFEPGSVLVAEDNGRIIGYILGCFDNRRYGLAMMFVILPKAMVKAFCRGVFFSRQFWGIVSGMLRNWPRLLSWRKQSFHSHEGHLHIGVAKAARHLHIGSQLVDGFLTYARTQHVKTLSASVHSGNTAAMRFFEKCQFELTERFPMVMYANGEYVQYHSLHYVKKI